MIRNGLVVMTADEESGNESQQDGEMGDFGTHGEFEFNADGAWEDERGS